MHLPESFAKALGIFFVAVMCFAAPSAAAKADNHCTDKQKSLDRCFYNKQDNDYQPSNRKATTRYIATEKGTDSEWDTLALVELKLQPIDPTTSCVAPPKEITIGGTPGIPGQTFPLPPMTFKFPQPLVGDGTRLFIQTVTDPHTLKDVTTLYLFGNGSTVVRPVVWHFDSNQRATYLSALAPSVSDGDFYDYFVKFRAEPQFGSDGKRKKNYVIEAFYPMASSPNPCDKERPDQENSKSGGPTEFFFQPGTGQGNEPVH